MSKKESLAYGRRAAVAIAHYRPQSILRVFYENDEKKGSTKDLAPLLKACAQQRKPYREVSSEELFKISGSQHHEGVVVVCDRPPLCNEDSLIRILEYSYQESVDIPSQSLDQNELNPSHLSTWVALDAVSNDHNLGAIARTLSWFGGGGMIWEGERPQLSAAALRIAQGGAEQVDLVTVNELSKALYIMKQNGFLIVGADQSVAQNAFSLQSQQPICWVLGSEQFGLSKACKAQCDHLVSIPGSGQIESLNVSVSAGILIAQSQSKR
jgi:RNA methyltransferase, TrmH family